MGGKRKVRREPQSTRASEVMRLPAMIQLGRKCGRTVADIRTILRQRTLSSDQREVLEVMAKGLGEVKSQVDRMEAAVKRGGRCPLCGGQPRGRTE